MRLLGAKTYGQRASVRCHVIALKACPRSKRPRCGSPDPRRGSCLHGVSDLPHGQTGRVEGMFAGLGPRFLWRVRAPVGVTGAGASLACHADRHIVLRHAPCLIGGKPMLRFMTALLALTGLTAAAPAHRQPTPGSLTPGAEVSDPARVKDETNEARDKAWDTKLKKTMTGVCRGC